MLFKHLPNADNLATSPTFVVGLFLLVLGAALWKKCYDTFGRFFTFQLAVHKDHKLTMTGLHAIVRHPSYTAFSLALTLPGGSYAYESGMLQTSWGAIFAVSWGRMQVGLVVAAVRQIPVDDIALREELGEEWDAWARKTPYALVP